MKLTRDDISKVINIEGFPLAKEEDIIKLSDPPYYTACPNPFIENFIKQNGKPFDEATDSYHRKPFSVDVGVGKNDPIYTAHSYHTKVPHKAIMRYILHYTDPGDLIFDGFSGSGMTGVAAQICGSDDPVLKKQLKSEIPHLVWGERYCILNDLSPAATYISYNYCSSTDIDLYDKNAKAIIEELRRQCEWMYTTSHNVGDSNDSQKGIINYTVWSDVFICPYCSKEIVYWNVAVDFKRATVMDSFNCDSCNAEIKKVSCKRAQTIFYDNSLKKTVSIAKQVPVLINYIYNGKRYKKMPDSLDMELIDKIEQVRIPFWYPNEELPKGYNTEQPKRSHGVTNVHLFYTKRTQYLLSALYNLISIYENRTKLLTLLTGIVNRNAYKCNRYVINKYNPKGRINGPKSGTLYIPSLVVEQNIITLLEYKFKSIKEMYFRRNNSVAITTQSSTALNQFPDNSIDYIFTDPPFGDNLNYSELSFIWETWLKLKTNNKTEAVINKVQRKGIIEYQWLMTKCFEEFYRILKPNRWMTVEFHNSRNAVWNSIQEALIRAGFIVADIRILDKKRPSLHQLVAINAVKKDLAITAYKPKDSFKRDLISQAGSEETAWSFVRQHLENLPVAVVENGKIELIVERQAFLLFDRMVAYHIMNGISVPLDASDFYRGLDERFMKRDEMYFLSDQVNEYDTARIMNEVEQIKFQLFVTNEKSAIAWLYQQLVTPQTYAELQPKFMQESKTVDKYEAIPELSVLLEDSFLQDDKGKWYIPDRTKEADVARLREKRLLKEFEGYLAIKGKLKLFRTEAIRVGFAKLWADKNYKLIVDTAERLPEKIIQEDDKLLMYYDLSLGRV